MSFPNSRSWVQIPPIAQKQESRCIMDKETLIEFLKDNLTIRLTDHTSFYEKGIKAELSIDDVVISEDFIVLETSYDM